MNSACASVPSSMVTLPSACARAITAYVNRYTSINK